MPTLPQPRDYACKRFAATTPHLRWRFDVCCTRWATGFVYIATTYLERQTSCFHGTGKSFWSMAASGTGTNNAGAQKSRSTMLKRGVPRSKRIEYGTRETLLRFAHWVGTCWSSGSVRYEIRGTSPAVWMNFCQHAELDQNSDFVEPKIRRGSFAEDPRVGGLAWSK